MPIVIVEQTAGRSPEQKRNLQRSDMVKGGVLYSDLA